MRDMMNRLKLKVNEQKTRLALLPDETFDFLGYTFVACTIGERDTLTMGVAHRQNQ